MCGITGAIWNDPAAALDVATLERMTDLLAHRGPDDRGEYRSDYRLQTGGEPRPGVALGHRRLSIIDLAGSRQPIANEDGSIWVVFNGEIYNYRDLRRRLEGAGHRFRSDGDVETIVHLYEDEGVEFAKHLWGMFAVAIWDAPRRRLVLARDRLGKKPLVYRVENNRLLFASELKSILAVPGVPREIDPGALDEYLTYQYVPHPNTIFRGIRKLPPGHYAVWREGRLEVRLYWQPDFRQQQDRPFGEYVEELRDAADRFRAAAVAERRAAGGVSLGRRRFVDHRRPDEPFEQQPGEDVFDRLSGSRIRRDALCPRGGRPVRHGAPRAARRAERGRDFAEAGLAFRRTDGR